MMGPTEVSAPALRAMLHFIANDLGIDDPDKSVNPVSLAREIRTMIAARPSVHIAADEDSVYVKVGEETFSFEYPGTLTGADLEKVLTAIGVPVEYEWQGTDCTEYDMEGYPI